LDHLGDGLHHRFILGHRSNADPHIFRMKISPDHDAAATAKLFGKSFSSEAERRAYLRGCWGGCCQLSAVSPSPDNGFIFLLWLIA